MGFEVVTEQNYILPIIRVLLLDYLGESFIEIHTTVLIIATLYNLDGNRSTEADGKTKRIIGCVVIRVDRHGLAYRLPCITWLTVYLERALIKKYELLPFKHG